MSDASYPTPVGAAVATAAPAAGLTPGRRRALAAVAWLLATLVVGIALRAVGWRETLAAASHARLPWLVAASLCHLAIIVLWAAQSWVLLPRAGRAAFARVFEVQAITATAANTIPAFLGQATGVAVLAERTGVGTAVALSVFAQHNLIEAVAKLATLAVASQLAPLAPWMRHAVVLLGAGLAALVVVLAIAAWLARHRPAHGGVLAAEGVRARTVAFLVRWAAGLDALRSPPRLALALAYGLLMKVAEAGGWWCVEHAFGIAPRAGSPVLALVATNLASALPASPGNLGVYEGAALLAYTSLGVPREQALALGLVGHVVYLVPFIGAGWLVLSLGPVGARRRRR